MDWNVFFSTVSQTCGAVIGIFSAFLITKIIADQSEFLKLKDKISDMVSRSEYLRDNFELMGFKELNDSKLKRLRDELYHDIKDTELNKNPESYYTKEKHPLYVSKPEVMKHIKIAIYKAKRYQREIELEQLKKEQTNARNTPLTQILGEDMVKNMQAIQSFAGKSQRNKISGFDKIHTSLVENSLAENSVNKSSSREQLRIDASHQINLNHKMLSELEGASSANLLVSRSLIIVLLLFYVGVIYPLSFLPIKPGAEITLSFYAFFEILFSLKGALLGLLTTVFSYLIVTFWSVNNRLKLSKSEINELKTFSKPEGFSQFLENYFENQK